MKSMTVCVISVVVIASCGCCSYWDSFRNSVANKCEELCSFWKDKTTFRKGSTDTNGSAIKTECPRPANSQTAEELLTSIANGAQIFSVKAGGGGECLFPTKAFEMSQLLPPVVAHSITGCYTSAVKPVDGYVCRYVVDAGRSNFWCEAFPAAGFTGNVYTIRKDLQILKKGIRSVTNSVEKVAPTVSK